MESLRPKVTLAIAPAVLYQTPDCSGVSLEVHGWAPAGYHASTRTVLQVLVIA